MVAAAISASDDRYAAEKEASYKSLPTIAELRAPFDARLQQQEDVFSLSAYAQVLLATGDIDGAECHFKKAIDAGEDAGPEAEETLCLTLGWYAGLVEGRGKTGAAQAEALYRRALRLRPRDPLSMGNYAVFLHRIKRDAAAAEAAYRAAAEAFPDHASTLCRYGSFLKHVRRNTAGAQRAFEAAIAANPQHGESLGHLAVLLHGARGDFDAAERLYARAARCDPHNVNNLSNYGLFLAEARGDGARAEALYARATALDPGHANALYNYAVLLDGGGGGGGGGGGARDGARADAMYRRCLARAPRHSYALYNLAVLVEERGGKADLEEARELYRRAVEAAPGDALALADYGRFLANVDREYDAAQRCMEVALESDPCCASALFNLGKLMMGQRAKRARARELFARCVEARPDHAGAHHCLARMLLEGAPAGGLVAMTARDLQKLKAHYEAALAADAANVELMREFATVLAYSGASRADLKRSDDLQRQATAVARDPPAPAARPARDGRSSARARALPLAARAAP